MNVSAIIEAMGGRPSVARLTGVKAPQISHMFTREYIPSHHIRLFIALRPELDWNELLNSNTCDYIDVLTYKGVQDLRFARLLMHSASV
jgi:DNA-binding transcriptional regulator YdaS (Cro superfamily)